MDQARWQPCFFSNRSPFFLAMLVHLCWGPVAQSLVRPLPVVELQVHIDRRSGVGDGLVSFQIHLLVLDAPPQPLQEEEVQVLRWSPYLDNDEAKLRESSATRGKVSTAASKATRSSWNTSPGVR